MLKEQSQLCIIIPAFNEANNLDIEKYSQFLAQNATCAIVAVNDYSSDNTQTILQGLQSSFPDQLFIFNNEQNVGKGESVRNGMLWALENIQADKYAFLDADLATSLSECLEISKTVTNEIAFSFGSRILTINANIKRKVYRHYIGRVVATAISTILRLEVYDTQCGCKVFDKDLCKIVFQESFISRWLFDVEIFFRVVKHYGREQIKHKMLEYPLKNWEDKGESKVKFSYFFKLWLDLLRIRSQYKGI